MQNLYCITPSLFYSWYYFINDIYPTAYNDLLSQLTKTKTKPTEAQIKGLKFEENIQGLSDFLSKGLSRSDNYTHYSPLDEKLASIFLDCHWQVPVSTILFTQKHQLYIKLLGRVDVFNPTLGYVYDLKFTSTRHMPNGMVNSSIQHLCYLYCLKLLTFYYVFVDSSKYKFPPSDLPAEHFNKIVFFDTYHFNSQQEIFELLINQIDKFLSWLLSLPYDNILKKAYSNNWICFD